MTDTGRAYRIYLYAACLISMLLLLFSVASALYGVVRIGAPRTTSKAAFSFVPASDTGSQREDDERDRGVAQLIQSGILAVVAAGVFAFHWTRAGQLDGAAAPPVVPPPVVKPPAASARAQRRPRSKRTQAGDEESTP